MDQMQSLSLNKDGAMKGWTFRTLLGLLAGYVAYLPTIFIVEYAIYGRVDAERAFYALYYALGAPFLLTSSGWQYVQKDEVILNLLGALLLICGALAANNKRARELLQPNIDREYLSIKEKNKPS
jgi:hypothetical protein